MPPAKRTALVAALDFGSTYSGYAFALDKDKDNIHLSNPRAVPLQHSREPTTILCTSQGKFCSFGEEAEERYIRLSKTGQHNGLRLFRHFKTSLEKDQNNLAELMVHDITGKPMKAMVILTMCMRCLCQQLLQQVASIRPTVREDQIQYAIAVPASWDINKQRFLKYIAKKAGIDYERVMLVQEPEAASIWCQTDAQFPVGTQYMIVDLGGGRGDVAVLKKLPGGQLHHIHKVSSVAWGGTLINDCFENLIKTIIGEKAFTDLTKLHIGDYLYLLREFETCKRQVPGSGERIAIPLPKSFMTCYNKYHKHRLETELTQLGFGNIVVVKDNYSLSIDVSVITEWFDRILSSITGHIKHLLDKPEIGHVSKIILIGGLAENNFVRRRFREEIPGRSIITPLDASFAVVKGTVKFGHDPRVISRRVLKYSYGIRGFVDFDPNSHPLSHMILRNGKAQLRDGFVVFARAEQHLDIHDEVFIERLPTALDSTRIQVLQSSRPNPCLASEEGCEEIGVLNINHQEGKSLKDKKLMISFYFGDTDLVVTARVLKTAEIASIAIDCLE